MGIEPVDPLEAGTGSAVSWGAVLAGAAAAAALTLILLALGAGIGFASISPWSSTLGSTTFHIATGLYFIVTAMIASGVGGYLAGRLRHRWAGTQPREIFFRDTAHGFLAWAVATLFSAAVLTTTSMALAGGVAAGMTQTAGKTPGILDGYVDALSRGTADAGTVVPTGETAAVREEIARVFTRTLQSDRDVQDADRSYLTALVAARTGLSHSTAQARVDAALEDAKTAIDKARKAAAQLSLWTTASLLIGALAASLAAIEGGGLREGTWAYQV